MATNTNYTTKTAALKATRADVRQVQVSKKLTSKEVWIDDENGDSQNVLTLIQNAGLNVGADADGDYTPDANTVKTNKINFLGAYVNVVDNGTDGVNIYIGENKNNPSYSSLNDISAENYYVYASSTNAWSLPTGATAGSQFPKCSKLSDSESMKLQNGAAIGNILKDATIKVTVTSDQGTFEYETPDTISSVAGKTAATLTSEKTDGSVVKDDAPTTKTWDDTNNTGIKIVASGMMKYTSADAKNGFTPNSSTGIFTVTVKNNKVVGTNGGWYKVSVQIGSGTPKSTSLVYVYGTQVNTPSVGKPKITYTAGTEKHISGLVYDSTGSFTLTVDDIANTQQSMTTSLNRLALTTNTGDVNFAGTIATNTNGMSVTGTSTDETAVYKYTATKSASTSTAKKVSAGITAQAYGQSAVAGDKVASDTCTATTYLYTDNKDDEDLITYFQKDGARKYGNLDTAKSASGATTAYDSTKSLITDYKDQLLVQDGKLRYPNSDTTTRYSGATETRYYVRPIKFGGSGQIKKISVKVKDLTSFNNGSMRLYLVKKGEAKAQVLNWFKTATCSYGQPISTVETPDSSNTWICEIHNDTFTLFGGVADTYYLVVEMTSNSAQIGEITLANAD